MVGPERALLVEDAVSPLLLVDAVLSVLDVEVTLRVEVEARSDVAEMVEVWALRDAEADADAQEDVAWDWAGWLLGSVVRDEDDARDDRAMAFSSAALAWPAADRRGNAPCSRAAKPVSPVSELVVEAGVGEVEEETALTSMVLFNPCRPKRFQNKKQEQCQ